MRKGSKRLSGQRVRRVLPRKGRPRHSPLRVLQEKLQDSNVDVRVSAIVAIGSQGKSAAPAVPAVLNALTDPVLTVRFASAQALRFIDDGSTCAELRQRLPRERNRAVRAQIRETLERLSESVQAGILPDITSHPPGSAGSPETVVTTNGQAAGPNPSQDIFREIASVERELSHDREKIRKRIELLLQRLTGYTPETQEQGKEVARRINEFVAGFGLRLTPPDSDMAATLAFQALGRTSVGAFVLRGYVNGKQTTSYAKTSLPPLRVIPVPPRANR